MSEKAKLYQKLHAVMKHMNGVPKKGKHSQGWNFMRADDVFDHARQSFIDNGLLVIPGIEAATYQSTRTGNKTETISTAIFSYTIVDIDTGESITTSWPGESTDFSDKGTQQAGTSSMKYMLMKMFLATPDHDPDYNSVDTETGEITAPKVTADKAKQTLNGSKTRKMETRGEIVLASIGLKARDDGNPFLTVEVDGKKYFSFTRQPFRDADILCDHWDEPGKTYSFPSARVEWEENNSGQRIITTVEKLPELAKASGE